MDSTTEKSMKVHYNELDINSFYENDPVIGFLDFIFVYLVLWQS